MEFRKTVRMAKAQPAVLEANGLEVTITNPDKVMFPQAGHTKLDIAKYYLAVAAGALRGAGDRPNVLVRYPNGVGGEFFYQKRTPDSRPPWLEVVTISFPSGRTAAALARDVERRAPALATSAWWKEERHGVFIDYNQNAKDRTVASAWSVRPTPDARVSMPLDWDEVADCDPTAFTLITAPKRFAERGNAAAGIDQFAGSLDKLLELSAAQEAAGLGDAPWPPHYEKKPGEPPRVMPSRKKGARSGNPQGEKQEKSGARTGGRRQSKYPLITVAKAKDKEEALAGLERWKARHPEAAKRLEVDDVLVDPMRGRYTTWTRIRVNLRHVPEGERPAEEPPDQDYDPWEGWEPGGRSNLYPPSYRNAGKSRGSSKD